MHRLLPLFLLCACGVEYHPGDGHTDSAAAKTAVAVHDTVVRVDTVMRVDTVWLARDSLIGIGDTSAVTSTVDSTPPPSESSDVDALRARRLAVPVQGVAASALVEDRPQGEDGARTRYGLIGVRDHQRFGSATRAIA